MSKATFEAPANIAFIKYWGVRDAALVLPNNPSISMTLSHCVTTCTAEPIEAAEDEIWLAEPGGGFIAPKADFGGPILRHLDRLRGELSIPPGAGRLRIATRNNFPSAAGLASSASGFSALTLAASSALGRGLSPREASLLARRSGSGSACRSVLGGYVEWSGTEDEDSFARPLAEADHWDLRDIIAVVEIGPKSVSSRDGHALAPSSPYYERRLELIPDRLTRVRRAIAERDFASLGATIEEEAIDLHLIAMSAHPPIHYWSPGSVEVLRAVRELRQEGLAAWSTMDAGANVHVICEPDSEADLVDRLESLPSVGFVIRDSVGDGPERMTEHLI
ncbi:MAG TPA: diphosphomevalonate decarboxylase [Thermoanaerobaculia bacterium]|jgi:diphosphomevalonate decarboxylase|nr:diphosphomevalonate decarboxylase [Thermoanaerobaculia bacterium]